MGRLTDRKENRYYEDEEFVMSAKELSDEQIDDIYYRLAELEDKLESGLMVELPCKIGDRVYEPNKRGFISTYRVTSIVYMENSVNCCWEIISGVCSNVNGFNAHAIGEKVFLTLAEAYEKLMEATNE